MKTITLLTALLPLASAVAEEPTLSPEMVSASEVISTQENQTYTYVRCWYRTSYSKDDPATDWEWAKTKMVATSPLTATGGAPFHLKTCSTPTRRKTLSVSVVKQH